MKATSSGGDSPADRFSAKPAGGIEVQEEELSTITAQKLYQMRCECGRSWFELELSRLAKCPACSKLGVVDDTTD
ncbi:MAG TPA: hypothetical protein VHZ99_12895 [Steroidobacteraceae bacterium]|jgi:hypothetical protein|nr:hypothetical protein [Steroidobacteraceae bacterium]